MHVARTARFRCLTCNCLTERKGSNIGSGRYCSPECYHKGQLGRKTVTLVCPVCGRQFERQPAQTKGRKTIFCSRECQHQGATRRLQPPPREELERLYEELGTVEAVSKQLRVSTATARRWVILDLGITPHHRRGTRRIASNGYVRVKVGENGWQSEHRVVMERWLGRPLLLTETIHHRNGDRTDNRIENLELRHGQHGAGVRLADHPHCPTCTCDLQMKT